MQSQQSIPTKWDLSDLFKNDEDTAIFSLRNDVEKNAKQFIEKWSKRSDYLNDPIVLAQAISEYEHFSHYYGAYGTEVYYFNLKSELNQNDTHIKAKYNTIADLSRKLSNELQFFTHRISLIPKEKQSTFLNFPELKPFKHFLELLFDEAKYLLSEEAEKILNLKSKTSYANWMHMTAAFLSKESGTIQDENGNNIQKNFEEILNACSSTNKNVRDNAAKSLNEILNKHSDVAEVELNSILENKKIDDELRHVKRPDETRHSADDIETNVVDALVQVVHEHNSIAHDYYDFKAKLFKTPKLAYHERNVEFGEITSKYSYQNSVALVAKVFENLDSQFADIFNEFVTQSRIDVFPNNGKRGGAFCSHNLLTNPTYILLNHSDELNDVLTLAHESGHGINNELIRAKQNSLNFATPTSTAEVASTFMEDFVLQELIQHADEESKLSLLVSKLNSDISTIFRQIAAYQFERALHEEFRKTGYVPKQKIGELFTKHMSAYMGPAVEQSRGSENWWIYWIHIRYFFYNYSYASGLLISKALQAEVKKNKLFVNKVKEFLAAGRSDSPKNIFLNLGIDISEKAFWKTGLAEVQTLLNQTKALATKLKKV